MPIETALVAAAAFLAGLVDSIVGGGGLVLVPALFASFPTTAPATLLGTNKCASVWGTAVAARQFARRVDLGWSWLVPAAGVALVGAMTGAWTLTQVDASFLRRVLPFLLLVVLLYTLANKRLGMTHAPSRSPRATLAIGCAVAFVIGWYDGFFGPGAGSFFIFALVRLLGFDFLHASASAKVLNVATNAAALALLAARGHVWWQVGAILAVANVAGSLLGARLALKHGAGLVRRVFVGVVSVLILKTAYDAFLR